MGRRQWRRLALFYLGLAFPSGMSTQPGRGALTDGGGGEVRQAIGREVLP